MNKCIPFFKPLYVDSDLMAVKAVLDSGILTYGPQVLEFEEEFKKLLEIPNAIAVNSATSGLHLALIALGIKKGDKVIVPVNTYAATALAVEYVGAEIVFCDIDSNSLCIDLNEASKLLKKHNDIKAMIPVHLGGRSIDIDHLNKLKKEFNIVVIEDAAHAFYTKYQDQFIGNFSDVTVFSFHPNKTLGTSEGGMVCCASVDLDKKIRLLKSTGINREYNDTDLTQSPSWLYDVETVGYKYAMDSISASIARSQMKKAQGDFELREKIARKYCEELKKISEINLLNYLFHKREHSYHLFIIKVKNRDKLYEFLKSKGIETSVHYRPLHLHSKWRDGRTFVKSEEYYKEALSLPIYPALGPDDQKYIIDAISEFYKII